MIPLQIEVLSIGQSRKSNALAGAKIRLTVGDDIEIIVADLRILQSKSGTLWVGRPSFVTSSPNGEACSYTDVVEFDTKTNRAVEEAVLESSGSGASVWITCAATEVRDESR